MSFRSETHKKRLALILGLILAGLLALPVSAFRLSGEGARGTGSSPVLAEGSRGSVDGLELSKSASYNPLSGKVNVTLEAFVTGIEGTPVDPVPTDYIFVISQGSTMNQSFGTGTRQSAITGLIKSFAQKIQAHNDLMAQINDCHKLGVIGFSNMATTHYAPTIHVQPIINNITNLTPASNASRDYYLGILQTQVGNILDSQRNTVIIFFADGPPTGSGTAFNVSNGHNAVERAHLVKKDYGRVDFHTIGLFDGANADVTHGDAINHAAYQFSKYSTGDLVNQSWAKPVQSVNDQYLVDLPAMNRIMNFISSNSRQSTHLGLTPITSGKAYEYLITYASPDWQNRGYYQTPVTPAGLEAAIANIAAWTGLENPSGSALQLGADTILADDIAAHFTNISNVTVQLANGTGFDAQTGQYTFGQPYASGLTPVIDTVNRRVSVTGFDYSANYVTKVSKPGDQKDYGKKLIVNLTLEPGPGFFGGNGVPTNLSTSGIYLPPSAGGTLVDSFNLPQVDLPLNYEIMDDVNQTIYLGQSVDLASLISFITVNGVHYSPNGTNNGYVRITYSLFAADDPVNPIATYVISPGQHKDAISWTGAQVTPDYDHDTYLVKVLVEPSQTGTYQAIHPSATIRFSFLAGSITLVKEATSGTVIDPGESFIVRISDALGNSWTVILKEKEPISLKGLPLGSYWASEDTTWSWRYTASVIYPNDGSRVNLQPPSGMHQTVTIMNEKIHRHWLTDEDSVLNHFRGY